jgi:lysophospholipase L1-like esterase
MKKTSLTFSIVLLLLFSGQFLNAQDNNTVDLYDGKTPEQVLQEYKVWVWVKNDWPALGYYREANEKLKKPALKENRIVFMGNSITEGWILKCPEYFDAKPYINRGISGQTTPQMLVRFRQDVIDLEPKAVVLLCGINDIAENTGPSTLKMIEDNITSMAELARANGILVLLCSVLPAYDFPWKPGMRPAEKIIELNRWIKKYSFRKKGLVYVDYYSSMADERGGLRSEYTEDGVHPNKAGYKVMEGLVEKSLAEALMME